MNSHLISIKSNKPLTHKQRSRLYDRLKEMLNGEGSDFWEEDDVEVVPTLVSVETLGQEGKLKVYSVTYNYTVPYGPSGQPLPTEERQLYLGMDVMEARRILERHNRGKSWDHQQYARMISTDVSV